MVNKNTITKHEYALVKVFRDSWDYKKDIIGYYETYNDALDAYNIYCELNDNLCVSYDIEKL